ncbi:MAG: hypothetical protein WA810_09530, partial [Maribacter sp.]
MKKVYCLSFSLFFLSTICFAEISKKEKKALIDLHESTNGNQWIHKWDLKAPVADWYGVTVENDRVIGLNLFRNNLMGPLSHKLGDLEHLQVLNLAFNSITGELPQEISALTELQVLKLEMNRLNGALPTGIGALSKLVELSVFNNFLTGEIPESVGKLTTLKILNLSSNAFYGAIPNS